MSKRSWKGSPVCEGTERKTKNQALQKSSGKQTKNEEVILHEDTVKPVQNDLFKTTNLWHKHYGLCTQVQYSFCVNITVCASQNGPWRQVIAIHGGRLRQVLLSNICLRAFWTLFWNNQTA